MTLELEPTTEICDHNSRPGCGSTVVKVSDDGRHAMSSSPVPLKTRRVGQRCTLNLLRAETSSRWCGVVVRRGGARSSMSLDHGSKLRGPSPKSPRIAEQCDVNIHSLIALMCQFLLLVWGNQKWPCKFSGYGHGLVTGVSRVRDQVPLQTHRVESKRADAC
ncbi:uncharacterized protein TNCV_519111 [Trichonephila clavipes]|nr:uncharacterized protein TNCV_519111 [Trichonephila clavipes]